MNVFREREGPDSTNLRSDKRLYEVWQGSNKFLCCGRLIFGPDVRSLYMTLVLILVPMASFCVFVGRHLMTGFSDHSGIAIMVFAVIHTCAVLTFLLLTSARDPGIIPRNSRPPEIDDGASSASEWIGGQTPKLPRTKDVIVNGISVKVKYCDTCMLYRPPRCSHCSICNNCVERFDHHCPWVGQCIGRRNYRSFFMFVLSATLLCMFVFSMCALRIKQLMDGDPPHTVWKALQRSPASAFLMAYTFLATWFVGGLTVFHLYLISTNQTTYENFRYRYDNKINAYDLGSCRNFDDVLCSGAPPSQVNFRAKVQLETLGSSDYNTPSRQRENMDMLHPNRKKATSVSKVGLGREFSIGISEDVQYRPTSGGGVSKEITKHGMREDMLFETIARPIIPPNDPRNTVVAHAQRNSNWEMSTEILGRSSPIGREGGTHNKVAYSVASYK